MDTLNRHIVIVKKLPNHPIPYPRSKPKYIPIEARLIKNGEGKVVDLKVVSEMPGHADVGITLKIYHHISDKVIKQVHQDYSPLRELGNIGASV